MSVFQAFFVLYGSLLMMFKGFLPFSRLIELFSEIAMLTSLHMACINHSDAK